MGRVCRVFTFPVAFFVAFGYFGFAVFGPCVGVSVVRGVEVVVCFEVVVGFRVVKRVRVVDGVVSGGGVLV